MSTLFSVVELAGKEVERHPCLQRLISSLRLGDETAHIVNAFRDDNAELA